jgi:hypothetical protein
MREKLEFTEDIRRDIRSKFQPESIFRGLCRRNGRDLELLLEAAAPWRTDQMHEWRRLGLPPLRPLVFLPPFLEVNLGTRICHFRTFQSFQKCQKKVPPFKPINWPASQMAADINNHHGVFQVLLPSSSSPPAAAAGIPSEPSSLRAQKARSIPSDLDSSRGAIPPS